MEIFINLPGALSYLSKKYIIEGKTYWQEFLKDILGTNYKYIFDGDKPKDYILLYLNGIKLDHIHNIKIKDKDSLTALSAISGG